VVDMATVIWRVADVGPAACVVGARENRSCFGCLGGALRCLKICVRGTDFMLQRVRRVNQRLGKGIER